jgi:hypothetical protein
MLSDERDVKEYCGHRRNGDENGGKSWLEHGNLLLEPYILIIHPYIILVKYPCGTSRKRLYGRGYEKGADGVRALRLFVVLLVGFVHERLEGLAAVRALVVVFIHYAIAFIAILIQRESLSFPMSLHTQIRLNKGHVKWYTMATWIPRCSR